MLGCSPTSLSLFIGMRVRKCVYVLEGAREMVGECIKLPSLGPGPLHMMDHSPKAKHLISLSGKINKLSKYKKRMEGKKKRRWKDVKMDGGV